MGRPEQLSEQQKEATARNDRLIAEALKRLELEAARGKPLPTVERVCTITGVSRNTVRNRAWALERLKALKSVYKAARAAKGAPVTAGVRVAATAEGPTQEALSNQVQALLEQNALLYEEVLYLGKLVAMKEVELDELRTSSLSAGKVRYLR